MKNDLYATWDQPFLFMVFSGKFWDSQFGNLIQPWRLGIFIVIIFYFVLSSLTFSFFVAVSRPSGKSLPHLENPNTSFSTMCLRYIRLPWFSVAVTVIAASSQIHIVHIPYFHIPYLHILVLFCSALCGLLPLGTPHSYWLFLRQVAGARNTVRSTVSIRSRVVRVWRPLLFLCMAARTTDLNVPIHRSCAASCGQRPGSAGSGCQPRSRTAPVISAAASDLTIMSGFRSPDAPWKNFRAA